MKKIIYKSLIIYAFLYNRNYFVYSINDDPKKDQSKSNKKNYLDNSKCEGSSSEGKSKAERPLPPLPHNYLLVEDEGVEVTKRVDEESKYYKNTIVLTGGDVTVKENDTTKYDVICTGAKCEYRFKEGVKCVEIKYKDITVWKHNYDIYENGTPTNIIIDYKNKVCWVNVSNKEYIYKKDKGEWKLIFAEGDKLIVLDIKTKESTFDFNFNTNEEKTINTYVSNNGVLIKGVKRGNKIIWHATKPSDCADKVIVKKMGKGKQKVTIMLLNGEILEFRRYGSVPMINDKWKEIKKEVEIQEQISESDESQPIYQVIQFGVGQEVPNQPVNEEKEVKDQYEKETEQDAPSQPVELNINIKEDTDEFIYIEDKDSRAKIYIPKDGNLFRSVRQSKMWDTLVHFDIWNTEDQNDYVDKVVKKNLGLGAKDLILRHKNGKKTIFHRPFKFMPWNEKQEIPVSIILPISKYPSEINIVTIDEVNESKRKQNDTTKYIVRKYDNMLQYIFTDNAKCVEIKYKDETIWAHDDTLFKTEYLKEMYVNNKTRKIVFNRYRSHFIYTYSYDWISITGDNKKKLKHSDFKIITIDKNNDDETSINDTDKYYEEQYGNILKIKFKPGVKFVELKHDNKPVWRYNDHLEKEYPKIIYFHIYMKILFIETRPDLTYFYRYGDGEWKLESIITADDFSEYNISIFTKDEEGIKANDISKYEILTIGCICGVIFKDNIMAVKIKYDGKTVFSYYFDEAINEYPRGLYFVSDSNKRIVWNGDRSHYIYPQSFEDSIHQTDTVPTEGQSRYRFQEFDRGDVIGIKLNIDDEVGTGLINIIDHKDTNTMIYYPKDGYLFKSVADKLDIWNTDNMLLFLDKVIETYEGNDKKLILRNPDGNKTYFYKPFGSETWSPAEYTKETSIVPISKHPKKIELLFEDNDDPSIVLRNDITKYTLHKYGDFYHYVFHNANFVEVSYEKKSLWVYSEKKYGKYYPEEMYINYLTKDVVLNNYKTNYIYTYSYDWISITGDNKKKLKHSDFKIITIDKNNDDETSINDTDKYYEEQYGNILKIKFKPGVKFVELKHDNKPVWRYNDHLEKEYPKIIYFHIYMKILFIETRPDLTYFYRYGDGEWKLEFIKRNGEFLPSKFELIIKGTSRNEYNNVSFGTITGYKFKNKRGRLEVNYEGDRIFEYENDPDDSFIKEIYFLFDTEKIIVMLSDRSFYIYPQNEDYGLELVDAKYLRTTESSKSRKLRKEK